MRNKGQLDFPIITWIIIVFGLLLVAPIMLKIFNNVKAPVSAALGNVTPVAATNFNAVMNTAINFWDKVIIAAFIFATLLLFISAFLIDSHPFWIVLYILIGFFTVLFVPNIIGALNHIYGSATFATESAALPFMNSLINNFALYLIGVFIMTGIIIYGKIAFFGSGGMKR